VRVGSDMASALVFDFDGLIIDSEVAVASSWREVFEGEGLEFPDDLWRTMVGTRENDDVLWDELERLTGRGFDAERLDSVRRSRSLELASALPPLPGVVEVLDYAASLGLPTAIASSSSSSWVRGHLERLGLAGRFAVVCTKEDAPETKPDPGVYVETLRRLAVEPAYTIAFEDSSPGVQAAKAAGLWVAAVPGSYTEHMDFSAADILLGSLGERELEWILKRFAT